MDNSNTFFLVEDTNNIVYKMPLATLGDLIVINNEENQKIQMLIESINELSSYILDLSSDFVKEHYSFEELSTNFELLTDTDSLLTNKDILNENDVEKYIFDKKLILKTEVESEYDNEQTDADKVFEDISNESENYF